MNRPVGDDWGRDGWHEAWRESREEKWGRGNVRRCERRGAEDKRSGRGNEKKEEELPEPSGPNLLSNSLYVHSSTT